MMKQVNYLSPTHSTIFKTLVVNRKELMMETDMGAVLSLISEKTFKTVWCNTQPKLEASNVKLHT